MRTRRGGGKSLGGGEGKGRWGGVSSSDCWRAEGESFVPCEKILLPVSFIGFVLRAGRFALHFGIGEGLLLGLLFSLGELNEGRAS